ncbi:hypothetical protein GCM10023149_12520 [Mucilaginibacter gynuensis]|uniref:Outer membrane protein beta-barrel domain-containing protein n=1 Tax=Mucilaginibacter gynuensis TaxID=1302236 RepID=A0ABP8G236_9SPHI
MKKQDSNKIDKIFSDGLSDAENHIAFHDADWDAMEKMLDERPARRGVVRRLTIIAGSIAAMLILALGWFYLGNNDKGTKNNKKPDLITKTGQQQATRSKTDDTTTNRGVQLQGSKGLETDNARMKNEEPLLAETAAKGKSKKQAGSNVNKDAIYTANHPKSKPETGISNGDKKDSDLIASANTNTNTRDRNADSNLIASANNKVDISDGPVKINQTTLINDIGGRLICLTGVSKPRFALSILAAPDVNGVGSFNNGRVGTSAGVMLSYRISNKWSVTTGVSYAVKPYAANGDQYKRQWAYMPATVAANCNVLDVPLNINYQIYSKGKNSFSAGTGLSSYFMLSEKYTYTYANTTDVRKMTVTNQNQHIFGVANINVSYQRQINSKFNLIVQPYLKLPLTEIGFSQADLKTTGVAVGVGWNFNTGKPK